MVSCMITNCDGDHLHMVSVSAALCCWSLLYLSEDTMLFCLNSLHVTPPAGSPVHQSIQVRFTSNLMSGLVWREGGRVCWGWGGVGGEGHTRN